MVSRPRWVDQSLHKLGEVEIVTGTQTVIENLLGRFGRTFGDQVGFDVASGEAEPLFQLLCTAILACARTPDRAALAAAQGFRERGWTTADRLSLTPWRARVDVLTEAGFPRSRERLSFIFGSVADRLRDRYGGDLSELRENALREPSTERELLKEFRGVGDLPADLFFREAQSSWDELYPFVDEQALTAAARLGLPEDPDKLAGSVPREDLPRLACALARVHSHDGYEAVTGRSSVV